MLRVGYFYSSWHWISISHHRAHASRCSWSFWSESNNNNKTTTCEKIPSVRISWGGTSGGLKPFGRTLVYFRRAKFAHLRFVVLTGPHCHRHCDSVFQPSILCRVKGINICTKPWRQFLWLPLRPYNLQGRQCSTLVKVMPSSFPCSCRYA